MIFSVSTQEVQVLLQNVDATKTKGPDNISALMLNHTASIIGPSITYLFNLSGCFPAYWKSLNVTALPKKRTTLVLATIILYPCYQY